MRPLSIITGTAKGKALKVPASARPITNRIKRSVFDTLGDEVEGTNVLDLYAGAGNMGLEAMSRGAEHCTFIDIDTESLRVIHENVKSLGFTEQSDILRREVDGFLKKAEPVFDLIFIDPPFPELANFRIELLSRAMSDASLAIFRKPARERVDIPDSLELIRQQKYGSSEVLWLRKAAN